MRKSYSKIESKRSTQSQNEPTKGRGNPKTDAIRMKEDIDSALTKSFFELVLVFFVISPKF